MHTNKSSSRTSSMSKKGTVEIYKNMQQSDLIENFLKEVSVQHSSKSSQPIEKIIEEARKALLDYDTQS